ncbi:MAG: hypothetical protein KDK24_09770 [Pseudooceanicola sp.]|nr:hypothetical protein [Pseudooceanicola sp.]
MVGFLDTQHLMSNNRLGAFAEHHDTIVLKDGSVVLGYSFFQTGLMEFFRYNPKTGVTTKLGETGAIGSGEKDFSMIATDDGGFSVALITRAGPLTTDGRLTLRHYDKDASLLSSTDLASGFVEHTAITKTGGGYFVTYRDRSHTDGIEYKGAFYNDSNVLLKTIDFDDARATGSFARSQPQSVQLSNGNLATTWRPSDTDGTFVQIFKPNGGKVTNPILVSPAGTLDFGQPPEITVHPDGGFVVLMNHSADPLDLTVQRYSNTGKKLGAAVTFDTDLGQANNYVGAPQVGFTKAGLMVVAWTAKDLSGAGGADVFVAMFSKGGNLIAGPLLGSASGLDEQDRVDLTSLKNGNLLFSFNDDTNVQFSYQASIQGRLLLDPDSVWEGNNLANTKAGTAGDDVMLGLGGNDKINGGAGADYIKGGKGDDTLNGGDKADVLEGEEGDDILDGGKGNDQVYGGAGADRINGGDNDDELFGNDGNDIMNGGRGHDTMQGGEGADMMIGDGGNDTMYGNAGRNKMKGGGGNDSIFGGDDAETLGGQAGNDVLDGGKGNDKLFGGAGFDTLRGGDGDDLLKGDAGDDNLNSGGGNDREYGGAGRDRLFDSDGNDKMWGGADADTFVFLDTDFGKDVIKDFEFGVDVLDMGMTARAMEFNGMGDIVVAEIAAGVRFKVDADNWVTVEGAKLSDFGPNDLILESPF